MMDTYQKIQLGKERAHVTQTENIIHHLRQQLREKQRTRASHVHTSNQIGNSKSLFYQVDRSCLTQEFFIIFHLQEEI